MAELAVAVLVLLTGAVLGAVLAIVGIVVIAIRVSGDLAPPAAQGGTAAAGNPQPADPPVPAYGVPTSAQDALEQDDRPARRPDRRCALCEALQLAVRAAGKAASRAARQLSPSK